MNRVLIIGAGKIGSSIATLLHQSGDYRVILADKQLTGSDFNRMHKVFPEIETMHLDIFDKQTLRQFLQTNPLNAIVSCLPYFCNLIVAELAKEFKTHYFDLTEDVQTTAGIKKLATGAKSAFVPQCGLAPGLVGIIAHDLMQKFSHVDTVKLRVGALPQRISNAFHYALTWSTEGLINEYANVCHAIENGIPVTQSPLQDLEVLQIDGLSYEAFNTSGGLGSLMDICQASTLNYKTIRYPGHCEKIRVLMHDLKLDRDTLKIVLEKAIPKTYQDVVIIYVSVSGQQNGDFMEESYVKKIYPQTIAGIPFSAIQLTTAVGLCAILDLVLKRDYTGFILQEQFPLSEVLKTLYWRLIH